MLFGNFIICWPTVLEMPRPLVKVTLLLLASPG